jgi:hypothetical protein
MLCGAASGALIGGCDTPQAVSIDIAMQKPIAQRLKRTVLTCSVPLSS